MLVGGGAVTQLSIVVVGCHVEKDIAVNFVGKALLDQLAGELDDLIDMPGGARQVVDLVDTECGQVGEILSRHLLSQLGHRDAALLGFMNQLVVDIGNIDDPANLETVVDQVSLDGVKNDGADHVPDVTWLVDRGAAEVDANLARLDCLQRFLAASQRVVDGDRSHTLSTCQQSASWRLVTLLARVSPQQGHTLGLDHLSTAYLADLFTCLGLDRNLAAGKL